MNGDLCLVDRRQRAASAEALIFDFGGVLSVPQDENAWQSHVAAMAVELGLDDGAAMWSRFYEGEEWQLAKTGHLTHDEYWRRLLEPFGMTDTDDRRRWVQRLFEPVGGIHPRMRALLACLKGRYTLALLSNASEWLETALSEEFELDGAFDLVVISAMVGLAKPDPAIYRLTLQQLGVPARAALFIDDQERNTRAAEALGIPSIVFPGVDELWAELAARGIL